MGRISPGHAGESLRHQPRGIAHWGYALRCQLAFRRSLGSGSPSLRPGPFRWCASRAGLSGQSVRPDLRTKLGHCRGALGHALGRGLCLVAAAHPVSIPVLSHLPSRSRTGNPPDLYLPQTSSVRRVLPRTDAGSSAGTHGRALPWFPSARRCYRGGPDPERPGG